MKTALIILCAVCASACPAHSESEETLAQPKPISLANVAGLSFTAFHPSSGAPTDSSGDTRGLVEKIEAFLDKVEEVIDAWVDANFFSTDTEPDGPPWREVFQKAYADGRPTVQHMHRLIQGSGPGGKGLADAWMAGCASGRPARAYSAWPAIIFPRDTQNRTDAAAVGRGAYGAMISTGAAAPDAEKAAMRAIAAFGYARSLKVSRVRSAVVSGLLGQLPAQ